MDGASTDEAVIAAALQRALEQGQLSLRYQPVVRLSDQQWIGVEALVSWESAELGEMPPQRFIPVAERHGLIVALGEWVLANACREIAVLQARHGAALQLAVNVSPLHLMEPDFLDWLAQCLQCHQLPGASLTLEITEGAPLPCGAETVARIEAIRRLGVAVALDDFGTGYCGLGYLAKLPVDKLKIDQSYVARLGRGDDADAAGAAQTGARFSPRRASEAVVQGIIEMGHRLSMHVVAEGVENVEQLAFLRDHRCDSVQGFLFAGNLGLPELEALCAGATSLPEH